jgi:YvrJ protein family
LLEDGNIVQLIGNFGFPIVITVYLLHRFENRLEALKNSIDALAKSISQIEK